MQNGRWAQLAVKFLRGQNGRIGCRTEKVKGGWSKDEGERGSKDDSGKTGHLPKQPRKKARTQKC